MLNRGYFQGWYFKCQSNDNTVAFIPSYHKSRKKTAASLQIITDSGAYNLPFDKIEYEKGTALCVRLGGCVFSDGGIELNYRGDGCTLLGKLRFQSLSPISYDIMGPFALVPFMQCRHSVYSMSHRVDGCVTLNSQTFEFHRGVGYIEGDRGRAFPKQYIWTQCCFDGGSLMLSVADIPLGFHFTGIIGVIMLNGREHRIATYLGARVQRISESSITVRQGGYELYAELIEKNAHPLFAPTGADMSRTIHESASCRARYRFCYKGEVLFDFISQRASFEFEFSNIPAGADSLRIEEKRRKP